MTYKHLSVEERELLQLLWWERRSVRTIANVLGRSPSSISRELGRNFPPEHDVYTPRLAHERALKKRKSRGRKERLKNEEIRHYVIAHLKLRWSPEQIAGRIKRDMGESISHEAIYQFIYAQIHRHGHGPVKPGRLDLRPCLRRKKKRRTPKGFRKCQRVLKPKGISIDFRPQIVAEKGRIGDWESDTVESKDRRAGVNTLLERKTGFFLVTKLPNKTANATEAAIWNRLSEFPEEARLTITFDNGTENSNWQNLETENNLRCFFAHPYHSWERGANENANGLLRDYFPKKTDFTIVTKEEFAYVERELNDRPRKRLGWLTPKEAMSVALQD